MDLREDVRMGCGWDLSGPCFMAGFYTSDTEQAGCEPESQFSLTLKSMLHHFGTVTWKGLMCKAHRMALEPFTVP